MSTRTKRDSELLTPRQWMRMVWSLCTLILSSKIPSSKVTFLRYHSTSKRKNHDFGVTVQRKTLFQVFPLKAWHNYPKKRCTIDPCLFAFHWTQKNLPWNLNSDSFLNASRSSTQAAATTKTIEPTLQKARVIWRYCFWPERQVPQSGLGLPGRVRKPKAINRRYSLAGIKLSRNLWWDHWSYKS